MIGKSVSMILAAMLAASTAAAQVKTVDPNKAGSMAATGPLEEHGQGTPVPPDTDAPAPASPGNRTKPPP